jgi:hypothetical protein
MPGVGKLSSSTSMDVVKQLSAAEVISKKKKSEAIPVTDLGGL